MTEPLSAALQLRAKDHASGAKDSRPELNRLLADGHRRRRDAVVAWKLDQSGPSLWHLVTGT